MGEYGTILGVWAHPDDETYLSAGLMAGARRAGDLVVCVTATRGEKGSWDEERWPSAMLGSVREKELLRSLELLGVTEHVFLDYPDGGCHLVDQAEATDRVAAIVRDVRPDTVLSFGPDGMTGHLDHKAVSSWATTAFAREASAGARLLYATTTPEWKAEFYRHLQEFNVFEEGPPVTPATELAVDFPVPPDLLELKLAAINEHTSQVEGMMNTFGADFFRRMMSAEYFRPAG